MDKKTKKEIREDYKEREVIGGVYIVKNTLKNKLYLDSALDLQGSKNRFEFAIKTGSCVHPRLQKDWAEQKANGFSFEILEELKRGETQSAAEFKDDLEFIKQIWLEKLAGENLY
ncbi:MAG: GIY-YIG nuclease family protein [Clostridiales bacterium]|nr:GIY-YIG nuclease family protein [Clostridiales bacterium]